MDLPVYNQIIKDIHEAGHLFIFDDYEERQRYYPYLPHYSPPDLHRKTYGDYLTDCKNTLASLQGAIRKIGIELQLLYNESPEKHSRSADFLRDNLARYFVYIEDVRYPKRPSNKCLVESVCAKKFYELKEDKFLATPGQLRDIFLVVIGKILNEIGHFGPDKTKQPAKELSAEANDPNQINFKEQYDVALYFFYSGLYDVIYQGTKQNASASAKIVAQLAGRAKEWNSIRPHFSHIRKYDPKNKDSVKLYNIDSVNRTIDLLESQKLDAEKLRRIKALLKEN